jgi:hypothetical protein
MKTTFALSALSYGLAASSSEILDKYWSAEEQVQLVENTRMYWAPEIAAVGEPIHAPANQTYRPTVVAHGMGDSGTNAGMKSICATVPAKYPGAFVLCSTTADGGASIADSFTKQLSDFTTEVRSHPELKDGFNGAWCTYQRYHTALSH